MIQKIGVVRCQRYRIADQPQDIMIDLPECGALHWVEPGTPSQQTQPGDTCFTPQYLSYATPLFSLEHQSGPLGGFQLELSVDGRVYVTIPVHNENLDIAHATLARSISL